MVVAFDWPPVILSCLKAVDSQKVVCLFVFVFPPKKIIQNLYEFGAFPSIHSDKFTTKRVKIMAMLRLLKIFYPNNFKIPLTVDFALDDF